MSLLKLLSAAADIELRDASPSIIYGGRLSAANAVVHVRRGRHEPPTDNDPLGPHHLLNRKNKLYHIIIDILLEN